MGKVPTQGKAMSKVRPIINWTLTGASPQRIKTDESYKPREFWECSHCGKHGKGKDHEQGPGFPRGWFAKYYDYDDVIYACSKECFNTAKEKRNGI